MMSDIIPQDITAAYPVQIPDEAVRAKLLELLGLESIPQSVDVTVDSEEKTAEGMTLTRLHFANLLGEKIEGILLIPPRQYRLLKPTIRIVTALIFMFHTCCGFLIIREL